MLGHKNGAAVLVRLYGCLVGADFLRHIHDFLFVKSDNRTEYRHRTYFVGAVQTVHGLAGYLTDTLSRNKSQTAAFFTEFFGNAHHVSSHDNRQFVMRAFFVNGKLDIGKVDHV